MTHAPASHELWFTPDHARFFLLPEAWEPVVGSFRIECVEHRCAAVDEPCLAPFELPEEQARRWMLVVLGQSLANIRHSIDGELEEWRERIAAYKKVTPAAANTRLRSSAAPAVLDLLKQVPGVIGNSLSGDTERIASAQNSMRLLRHRLVDAGIELDERFSSFPSRLAQLRADFDARRRK
jgi:hypothetical protein